MGAVGPNHYCCLLNRNFAVYNKTTGAEISNISIGSFMPGTSGDPRILYDQHSGRWIAIATNFSDRIHLNVSLTSDPTGSWYKTSFIVSQGSDAGKWPDYPTLGVDANGIYSAAFMVGGTNQMTLFAIDKAPLLDSPPSLGTVTAFRLLPWEGALQPVHTYGTPSGEYVISRRTSTLLRLRRVNPPLTAPTLTEVGNVSIPWHSSPPDAPALGSTTPLDTVGDRLMMSVYRDGSIWTAHTVRVDNRAACRWYEAQVSPISLVQSGTVADSTLHYFFPAIMVNETGHAVMGFTGSSANQYAGAYYTGRRALDPAGEMATPYQYRAGNAAYNLIDGYGRNRWGDYSYTTLDPQDESVFWTIQEYAQTSNIWSTQVAVVSTGDCNNNGVEDECDISCGLPGGACDVTGCGLSLDCNSNLIPDECETDCNGNNVPDDCDIVAGTSEDCNGNGVPDECDPYADCNTNGAQDICDIAGGTSLDCNANEVPDECDISSGTSEDCNTNIVPDECEPDGDNDGAIDDCDGCPSDSGKTDPGVCGCGTPETGDTDGDTMLDCVDNCVDEPNPGQEDCDGDDVGDACVITAGEPVFENFGTTSGRVTGSTPLAHDMHFGRPVGVIGFDLDYYSGTSESTMLTVSFYANDADNQVYPPDGLIVSRTYSLGLGSPAVLHDDFDPPVSMPADVWMEVHFSNGFYGWNTTPDEPTIGTSAGVYWDRSAQSGGSAYFRAGITGGVDCNANGVPDACDLVDETSPDCNANNVPDECDIDLGASADDNGNSVPDECEAGCLCGDLDGDGGVVDLGDFSPFSVCFGLRAPTEQCPQSLFDCADLNGDGWVNLTDFSTFQVLFGTVNSNTPPNCL
jgi:hypothetical protein